jgi:hypothetical protein
MEDRDVPGVARNWAGYEAFIIICSGWRSKVILNDWIRSAPLQ